MNYRNITISGEVATGTSTLIEFLKKEPALKEWEFFSGGEFMRQYAQTNGLFPKDAKIHHAASVYSDAFDRNVDYRMRESLSTKDHQVFEAWLSGFFAQKIAGVLKILLTCSDDAVRIDRIVNRDGVSVEEAKEHIKSREQQNVAKWVRLYKKEWDEWVGKPAINFWDPDLYDLVIDTYSHSKEETLALVVMKTK